ncbi:MAG TPA: hypothetical protein ENH23_05045 [candidate division Zixibacteria bacterium]|nr:hypothetical protein [candidate division Zixibacteria bacterium]
MDQKQIKLGVAWFREDQWELLKTTAADSETIEDTYQKWLTGAVKRMEELIKEGYETVKIDFDVDKFNDWCQNNEKVPNGESRSEYTAQLLRINDQFSSN